MARIRSIKPEFWQDEKLSRLPHAARLLFIGLWNVADDVGRLRGNPLFVGAQVFPYEPKAPIEDWLEQLEAIGVIRRYSNQGEAFIVIVNFLKHQQISKPTPSKLPAPEDSGSAPVVLREPSGETPSGKEGKGAGKGKEQGSAGGPPAPEPSGLEVGVQEVFSHWRSKTGVGPEKPGKSQAGVIRARLAEGWSIADLKRVADGAAEDIKRWPERANHVSVKVLYRDGDQVQKFVRLAPEGPRP